MVEVVLSDVNAMRDFATDFAKKLQAPITIALHGDLGMGKTEFARAVIRALCGENTVVPSPTFTLVQTYEKNAVHISHFDLYRINDVAELIEIGLDYAIDNDITLIEWPDIAADILPQNTLHIYISKFNDGRKIQIK